MRAIVEPVQTIERGKDHLRVRIIPETDFETLMLQALDYKDGVWEWKQVGELVTDFPPLSTKSGF